MLKWRLKLKADLEEKSALQDDKKAAADDDVTKGNADKTEETEESLIEDQIKEAIYNEKKTDKKYINTKNMADTSICGKHLVITLLFFLSTTENASEKKRRRKNWKPSWH